MAINHAAMSAGVDISSGGPAASAAQPSGQNVVTSNGSAGAQGAPGVQLPPTSGQPQQRRRIDELDDFNTATPDEDLQVDMGEPNYAEESIQPNDGDPNASAPELPADIAELKAKWDAPELAPELEEKFTTVEFEDGPEQMTIADLKKMAMRHADYSRKTTEVAQMRKSMQAKEAGFERLTQGLSDPQSFVATLEEWAQYEPAVLDAFDSAVESYVNREIEEFEAAGRNHEIHKRLKAAKRAERQAEHYKRQLEQQRAQRAQEAERAQQAQRPDVAKITRQLDQLVPRVFTDIGLPESATAKEMLGPELRVFWQDRSKPLTYAIVRDAAMAVKQHMAKQYGQEAVTRQPAPEMHPAPKGATQRLPAAAPANGGRRTPKRVDQLGGDWWDR
jgi:hypothetical protein